jgi:hypothetical protein
VNQPEGSLTKFERELMQAMRGVDPAKGFADRVMARAQVPVKPRARVLAMPSRVRYWSSGAVAAAMLAGALLGEQAHLRHERERTEMAQRQFETGLRITDQTLEQVRAQLQQAGVGVEY